MSETSLLSTASKTSVLGKRKSLTDTKEEATKKKQPVTLYNFGYAPKDVIEKFQDFCIHFPTLTAAIESLLERDKDLTTKYRFISTTVTYQMLARPTVKDDAVAIKAAILKLHKYAKDGRYKSVSDSIEELLMSPSLDNDKSPETKQLSNGCLFTSKEQQALEKITDAVYKRLQNQQSNLFTKNLLEMEQQQEVIPDSDISAGFSQSLDDKQPRTSKIARFGHAIKTSDNVTEKSAVAKQSILESPKLDEQTKVVVINKETSKVNTLLKDKVSLSKTVGSRRKIAPRKIVTDSVNNLKYVYKVSPTKPVNLNEEKLLENTSSKPPEEPVIQTNKLPMIKPKPVADEESTKKPSNPSEDSLLIPLTQYMDQPPLNKSEEFLKKVEKNNEDNPEKRSLYENCNLISSVLVPNLDKEQPNNLEG